MIFESNRFLDAERALKFGFLITQRLGKEMSTRSNEIDRFV